MATRIVGVDIGETALRGVEVENTPKARPTVLRYHEVPIPAGAVRSGEVMEVHTVATALKQLWTDGNFKSKDVVLGIGNQKVLARDLTVARQPIARIREALPFQVQELIPVPVEDALLDFYPIAEVEGEHGPAVAGLLIAAVKAAVEVNVRAVQEAGLAPVDVDLIPFALQRALGSSTGTTALIDVGAATTNVLLVTAGVPQFVRIIPNGGDDLTRALVSRLDIERPEAEQFKFGLGMVPSTSAPEHQPVVALIYEITSELLNSLRNTLNYFGNTRPNGTIDRIVLSGGGSHLPGFAQVLGEATGVPVEYGDPFGKVSVASGGHSAAMNGRQHSMTVALGLAMRGAA
ncbi:type IV pilus assembly protein PilM [Salinibacterium sp. ZJ454]|uniref:type IV pilus assembly protein PilM n=1 Tax=Salinibacterium sp. ZJ454 TaxID=2708339 RepID=UPI00141D93AD|nr:type IV pilus assembly protein PilM [Salinibacterium sp. ZJ454]